MFVLRFFRAYFSGYYHVQAISSQAISYNIIILKNIFKILQFPLKRLKKKILHFYQVKVSTNRLIDKYSNFKTYTDTHSTQLIVFNLVKRRPFQVLIYYYNRSLERQRR